MGCSAAHVGDVKFDLTGETDAGTFAIYDPGAVVHLLGVPADVEAEVHNGNLIVYSYGGDGDMLFRVFVDEPADAELERRAEGQVVGVLRVPTGRLVASGAEYLARPGKSEVIAIPAGNYEVTAFDVEWGDEAERAAEEAARRASPVGLAIESIVGPVTGLVIVVSLLTLMSLLFTLVVGETTLRDVLRWARAYGLWYLGLWAVLIGLWKLAPVVKATRAAAATRPSYPGAVVQLRRLPDGEDLAGRTGCVFGPH